MAGAHGEGNYYSDKSPLFNLAGAAIYRVLLGLGLDIRSHLEAVYRILTFWLVIVPGLALFYLGHRFLETLNLDRKSYCWALTATIFGTLVLPYSMVLTSLVAAASCLLGGFLGVENKKLPTAGLLLGLAASLEPQTSPFALCLLLLSICRHWGDSEMRASIAGECLLFAAPVALTWGIYRGVSGEWVPFGLQIKNYAFAGGTQKAGYLLGGTPFSELKLRPTLMYLWHGWFGYKGVFSHSAVLALGILGLCLECRVKERRLLALAILVLSDLLRTHLRVGWHTLLRGRVFWLPLHGAVDASRRSLRRKILYSWCPSVDESADRALHRDEPFGCQIPMALPPMGRIGPRHV